MNQDARIELVQPINSVTVERVHRRAGILARKGGDNSEATRFAQRGMRAAVARDSRLLLALEKSAEILEAMREEQMGRTQRGVDIAHSERSAPIEVSMWREAYKAVDSGNPPKELAFVYGAAAELAFGGA